MAAPTPTELREQFKDDQSAWEPIRKEAQTDLKYLTGDPWDAADRKQREDADRPCLALDELNQFVNQLINDMHANKRAIKVSPRGNGANDQTAQMRASLIREIEYRSRAQIAYTTMFENTVQRSYGFFRINTRPARPDSFDQDLWIDPVVNPDLITPDPDALSPDSSDMTRCTVHERWTLKEFNRRFKGEKPVNFSTELATQSGGWLKQDSVMLAECWRVETTQRRLLLMQPPATPRTADRPLGLQAAPVEPIQIFADQLEKMPNKGVVLRERMADVPKVVMYLTNGLDILDTLQWKGKYIPIVSCYGKIIYMEQGGRIDRKMLSMVRLARDPYMLYCFYRTCEAELVGSTTKNPVWAYEGQLSTLQMTEIQKSLHEPVAALFAKATTEATGPQLLPLPQQNRFEPPIQALEIGAESARRAIQAAIGSTPLPTQAQRHNEKSGVALQKIDEAAQKGSFHFVAHYDDAIRQGATILDDLIGPTYDTARDLTVHAWDGKASTIVVNNPNKPDSLDSAQGDHDITISVGPSYESEREAAKEFAMTLAQNPQVFPLIASEVVKLQNLGPVGEEIARLLDYLKPPELRAKPEPGDPRAMAQQLGQLQGQMQQLTQAAGAMKQEIETEQAKQKATVTKAKIDSITSIQIQKMKSAEAIAVAKIAASTKGGIVERELENELLALGMEHAQSLETIAAEHAHEVGLAEQEHTNAAAAADQAHGHALAQGEQGQQHALEAGQQAADLAPTPEATA